MKNLLPSNLTHASCLILLLAFGYACGDGAIDLHESSNPATGGGSGCIEMSELEYIPDGSGHLATYRQTPFSGEACSKFANGNIHTLTTFHNGLREGKWEVYYPNGSLHKRGYVKNGKENDIYIEHFLSGQLQYEYHYTEGMKSGIWKSWYESGVQYTERHFENDKLNGPVLVWDEQGMLVQEYGYRKGILIKNGSADRF